MAKLLSTKCALTGGYFRNFQHDASDVFVRTICQTREAHLERYPADAKRKIPSRQSLRVKSPRLTSPSFTGISRRFLLCPMPTYAPALRK